MSWSCLFTNKFVQCADIKEKICILLTCCISVMIFVLRVKVRFVFQV